MEWELFSNFERGSPKNHSCEVWSNSTQRLRSCCSKQLLTEDRLTDKDNYETDARRLLIVHGHYQFMGLIPPGCRAQSVICLTAVSKAREKVFPMTIAVDWDVKNQTKQKLECSRWYTIANTRSFTFDLDLGVMVTQNVAEYP